MQVKEVSASPVRRAERAERVSWRLLWWIPLSPLIGFTAANWLLAESWPLWQVIPLGLMLAIPFGLGAYHAFSALRLGNRHAWLPLVLHSALSVIALVMPITEALTRPVP